MPTKVAGKLRARRKGIAQQPVGSVTWIDRDELHANDYNPNHVAPPELELLKVSLLEDGWTQPIVARSDGEIVDGFHRWTVAADAQIAGMTGGMVPVVFLPNDTSLDHQMASTIRHNRARGEHAVLRMADIVGELIDTHGMTKGAVMVMFGMESEEVDRLYERGSMVKRGAANDFGMSWEPVKQA